MWLDFNYWCIRVFIAFTNFECRFKYNKVYFLLNCLQWCHSVAELHGGYWRLQVLNMKKNVWGKQLISRVLLCQYWSFVFQTVHIESSSVDCSDLVPALPTMQLSHWGTSLEALYQITYSFLWRKKKKKSLFTTIFTNTVAFPCKDLETPLNV